MTTRLIIARHGNTFNPGDIVTRVGGRTDLPLTDSGMEQGRKLGLWLQANNMLPDVVYTSTLRRTQQTARAALSAAETERPLSSLPQFDEIDYGVDENRPEAEVVARLGEQALRDWDERALVPEGWRVDVDLLIRDWMAFGDMLRTEQKGLTILVVTSNGIARFAPHMTGDFAAVAARHNIKLKTGALALLSCTDDAPWRVEAWGVSP
ncbi:MAG: histidine phosphatase family protein [Alphaproteobacteria bacterium]|nr:histidine phosphatase family protein [Alphaproteobacteria bacterium]MBV8548056.1 histidine phosphatase family protein [Alphaproteobacteria bacterium]